MGLAVRLSLLAVLVVGALVTAATYAPSERTLEQFRAAAIAGAIDRVSYQVGSGDVTALVWSESPLVWHEVPGRIADAEGAYTVARLMADLRRPEVQASVAERESVSDGNSIFPDWPFTLIGGSNLWWVAAAWVLTFLAMMGSTPRLANRWAWFWLFTVGQVGALVYLVLEPRPLWKAPGEERVPAERVDGRRGCLYSIFLGVVSVLVALGTGRLVGLVLG
ncbi:hypothetical protein [Sphaerisporangium sp. TRM90804]|uniref:hypothetical protein n=1 Tax=Sphaerisporangium sp. TRM90804 TaxID=3031113 RepID=UPI00244A7CD0|nr:hypothetical protein [Sphaerisporangium sp. TRM90804]MDH2425836.1 hypothetical protein [Sphaerisporangium sp. TRM90804]